MYKGCLKDALLTIQLFFYRVFHQSAFFRKLRRGYRPFRNAVILGDSAYTTNYRFLAVPLKQRRMLRGTRGWQRRRMYNFKFCQCRVVVEVFYVLFLIYTVIFFTILLKIQQCFGRMKNRWRILRLGLEFRSLRKSGLAIAAMAALQNFLLRNGDNGDVSYNSACLCDVPVISK